MIRIILCDERNLENVRQTYSVINDKYIAPKNVVKPYLSPMPTCKKKVLGNQLFLRLLSSSVFFLIASHPRPNGTSDTPSYLDVCQSSSSGWYGWC